METLDEWADAAAWAQRIATGRDAREREDAVAACFDALGAGGQWRVALQLLVYVVDVCPASGLDVRGYPSLHLLAPSRRNPGLAGEEVVSDGDTGEVDYARVVLQGMWDRLAGAEDPGAGRRHVLAVMQLFRWDHALTGTIRDLCVTALDTVARLRSVSDGAREAAPHGAGDGSCAVRVARDSRTVDLLVDGVWGVGQSGRRIPIVGVRLSVVDGVVGSVRLVGDPGDADLREIVDPAGTHPGRPLWLRIAIDDYLAGRATEQHACPEAAPTAAAPAHRPERATHAPRP